MLRQPKPVLGKVELSTAIVCNFILPNDGMDVFLQTEKVAVHNTETIGNRVEITG